MRVVCIALALFSTLVSAESLNLHSKFTESWKDGQYARLCEQAEKESGLLVLLIDPAETNRYEDVKFDFIRKAFERSTLGNVTGAEAAALLKDGRFHWMWERAGLAVLDFRNDAEERLKKSLIRYLPHELIDERKVRILAGIPAGLTLTQSTMTFAVREHPEAHSADGTPSLNLMKIAEKNSAREAENYLRIYGPNKNYGAANYYGGGHYNQGHGYETEVGGWAWSIAERPENKCMVKAAMSGVRVYEWIYSGQKHGHWGAVCQRWNYFGWDMQYVRLPDGRDGKWFITGDFANSLRK